MSLSVREVTVRYGSTVALDSVSLEVGSGEILAVIGPSGCGKSSLLRAVAGIEPLVGGSVTLNGRDLHGLPTHRRDVGLMFQEHALFPHLGVADNVGFGLEMAGWTKADRRIKVAEQLELVGLVGYGQRSIDELSGGEAQRVALARSLAPAPGLLMLDEPLGSLDRVLREQLVVELGRVIRAQGITTIHVTHDQAEAFALADKVVVLRDGRVQQIGSPDELWRRPTSGFVAEFLGHPNRWRRGERTLVVPETALAIADAGDDLADAGNREGLVESVAFREGRYRVNAATIDSHPHESLVFDVASPPAVGSRVLVAVDHAQTIEV